MRMPDGRAGEEEGGSGGREGRLRLVPLLLRGQKLLLRGEATEGRREGKGRSSEKVV